MHSHKLRPVSCSCFGLKPYCVANVGQLAIFKEEKSMLGSQGNQLGLSGLGPVRGGRFPRVFGDEFGDKFCEKFGDSLNLVKTLVTNSVTKLVNHQIW